jgi:hypothetical protein
MNTHYTVSLPVKAYIKKYVSTVEGYPINYSSNNMLCMIVRAYLQNKCSSGLSKQQLQTAVASRNECIEIKIPRSEKNTRTIGTYINADNIILINRFLEFWFEAALQEFIKEYTKTNVGRYRGLKGAYVAFADQYNIVLEQDISFEGLKKIEYRNRQKKTEINLFTFVPSTIQAVN